VARYSRQGRRCVSKLLDLARRHAELAPDRFKGFWKD
jgi:hypothetical protein